MSDAQKPPFATIRKAAMALYVPPFKLLHGYIYDSNDQMVADSDGVKASVVTRVRGWGRIGYMPNAEALQDEVGQMMVDAMNAYYTAPTLTPPLTPPDGWAEAVEWAGKVAKMEQTGATLGPALAAMSKAILEMDAKIKEQG